MARILVVDDDPYYLRIVEDLLTTNGFETLVAEGLHTAVATVKQDEPDLIISDVNLTDGDGFDLLRTLRRDAKTSGIPIILMTGDSDDARTRQGMGLGADDFLEKPLHPEWLLATLNAQLEKRQKARRRSEETQKRLVAILEATPDLVCIVNALTLEITYLNRAGRMAIGCDHHEDISGLGLGNLLSAESFAAVKEEALAVAASQGTWRGELVLKTRQRQGVPIEGLIQGHLESDGQVEFFSAVMHDLTERRRAEQERQNVEMQLRQAQKLDSIGRLAAGIAHEINTPTQFIGDNTRFLQDSFRDLGLYLDQCHGLIEAARAGTVSHDIVHAVQVAADAADVEYLRQEIPKAIQQSLEGIERVSRIVRAMKEFSHPDSGEKTPISLNQAIESTLMVCRNEWKYVAEMVTDFDPDLPPVPCLAGEFSQVILNLVINATHAIADVVGDCSKGKGKIAISTRRTDRFAEVRVQDSGGGIPEGIRHRIFEPFFTTKPVGKGTGQGLAIARSVVVDKHGGTLGFDSVPGKGTTFVIRLPLCSTSEHSASRESAVSRLAGSEQPFS